MTDFVDTVNVVDGDGKALIRLTLGAAAQVSAGGTGQAGNVIACRKSGAPAIFLGGHQGHLLIRAEPTGSELAGPARVLLNEDGNLFLGGRGANGDVVLHHANTTANNDADGAGVHLGTDPNGAFLVLRQAGKTRARMLASGANLTLGGQGGDGDLVLHHANTTANDKDDGAGVHLGTDPKGAFLFLRHAGETRLRLLASGANMWLGGNGQDGDIVLHPATVANEAGPELSTIHLSAESSRITLRSGGQPSLIIDGKAGDIVLANADGAEEFEVAAEPGVEPGAVLVVGGDSTLRLTDRPYDRCVAGIVSGAGDLRPGIVLGRVPGGHKLPVALFGRVHCKVDATYAPIRPGDLLTTSATPGHAMRAEPGDRAVGSVLGKAMRGWSDGPGMVPVLVALQ
jgi:hypothetical protein